MPKQTSKSQTQGNRPSRQVSEQQIIHTQYQGPIPPPNLLDLYESVHRGLADRIVVMAEKEQSHRQEMEQKDINAGIMFAGKEFLEARIGQFCALTIGLFAIGAGAYCATHGAPWPGALIGSSGVGGLVSVFIIGRQRKGGPNVNTKKES